MKKFIVPVLSVCLFFMSCSADEATTAPAEEALRSNTRLKSLSGVGNSGNQYDYIGELHATILTDYLENYQPTSSIGDIIDDVESVASVTSGFSVISSGYTGLHVLEVEWTIDNISSPENLIDSTSMTPAGKTELLSFFELLDGLEGKAFSYVHTTIMGFEDKVLQNSLLTQTDMKTILATTSTARYSIAYADDKDRQWSRTRTGILSSVKGDAARAVTTSVTANIVAD